MTRRLVLTADDLGRDPATDQTIAELARAGLITATTAIVVSPHAARAVERVLDAGLVPHLHATLTSEDGIPPWRPLTGVPSSTEPDAVQSSSAGRSSLTGPDGALPRDTTVPGRRAVGTEVSAELAAQYDRLVSFGAVPAVMDSHAGTLYGLTGRSFLPEAYALCTAHGLGFRLPRDATLYLGTDLSPALRGLHEQAVAGADAAGVRLPAAMGTSRRSATDLGSYQTLRDDYLRLLAALPEGTSEIFLHPSPPGAVPGPDGLKRAWELRLLRDPVFRSALAAEGLELVRSW